MRSSASDERFGHFRRHYLLWIVARHFLSAPLLQELSMAIVEAGSDGRIQLEDLFESRVSADSPLIGSWVISPKPVAPGLPTYLQGYVRSIVWQNDNQPIEAGRDLTTADAETVRALASAASLSALDIGGIASTFNSESIDEGLKPIVRSLLRLKAAPDDATDTLAALTSEVGAIEMPLGLLLVKHLGDLCADRDNWEWADTLYSSATSLLDGSTPSCWRGLISACQVMLTQSRAAAARSLKGPKEAATILEEMVVHPQGETDWLSRINVPPDLLAAKVASEIIEFPHDSRASILIAPQLCDTHHLSRAFEQWTAKKYDDAYRVFWSVLRRQIALGSFSYVCQTKGYYGQFIIDATEAQLERNRDRGGFQMGVRLLIESGSASAAEHVSWSDALIGAYVDQHQVEAAMAHALRAEGAREQRMLVLLTLFEKWLEVLQPDSDQVARTMLICIANAARDWPWSGFSNRNVGGAGFEALQKVAKRRPELRRLAASEVAAAIVTKLDEGGVVDGMAVLEVAELYVEAFEESALHNVIEAVFRRLDRFAGNQGPWPVVRPALAFLDSARRLLKESCNDDLRRKIILTQLRVTMANETENTSLMWLLHDIGPTETANVDPSRLKEIVADVQQRATQINSGAAEANISALLANPVIAGIEGLRHALDGLLAILRTTVTGRPPISFGYLYHSLVVLVQNRSEIDHTLRSGGYALERTTEQIFDLLLSIWHRAETDPLIFAGFAIPRPTAPNQVLVHNWAFASLGFARLLGREELMIEALEAAARVALLEGPISVARAVESPAEDPAMLAPEAIRQEKREAFYAALGQRLVAMSRLRRDKRLAVATALLEQCYRLGPRGEDAAIFIAALELGLEHTSSPAAAAYQRRLDNERSLRLSLSPLWRRLDKATQHEK